MDDKKDILSGTQELTLNDLVEIYQTDSLYSKDDIKIEYTDSLRTPEVILQEKRAAEEERKRKKAEENRDYDRVISNTDLLRAEEKVEKKWDEADISKDYFKDKYNGSFYKLSNWFLKGALIIIGVFVVLVGVSLVISLVNKNNAKYGKDITHLLRSDEKELAKQLNLDFEESDYYKKKVPMITNEEVKVKADEGFATVYLDDEMVGVYFDSTSYKIYGYKIGDKCNENFRGLEYEYNKKYVEEKGQRTGNLDIYYLYNTRSNIKDCMIIAVDKRKKVIREMGYFYDYTTVMSRLYK